MVKSVITEKIIKHDSFLLAGIYTIGHIFIASTKTFLTVFLPHIKCICR